MDKKHSKKKILKHWRIKKANGERYIYLSPDDDYDDENSTCRPHECGSHMTIDNENYQIIDWLDFHILSIEDDEDRTRNIISLDWCYGIKAIYNGLCITCNYETVAENDIIDMVELMELEDDMFLCPTPSTCCPDQSGKYMTKNR